MSFAERIAQVKDRIEDACSKSGRRPEDVKIVAVTKTATEHQIFEAIEAGQYDLGENRSQVLESHAVAVGPNPNVRWHMIGHVQRNKVRDVLSIVHMIHSVDSLRLANEIEKEAARVDRKAIVLLQINAGEEHQKFGASLDSYMQLAEDMARLPHLDLRGVMSMAPLTEDTDIIRRTFARTREAFENIKRAGFVGDSFTELSMGMSEDFEIAVQEGATIIRLGSILFGSNT